MDFHSRTNRYAYTNRQASQGWKNIIQEKVHLTGLRGADLGCGGGIYTRALIDLGAARMTGVDFSEVMIETAKSDSSQLPSIDFIRGNALQSGLATDEVDFVLERALIHHIAVENLVQVFAEARRVLKTNGVFIIQDRTPEDILLPGSPEHIRGYFFDLFPRLLDEEMSRRHSHGTVTEALQKAGFNKVEKLVLWEERRTYPTVDELSDDLTRRVGRSILHKLTDEELKELVAYVKQQLNSAGIREQINEKDRWTIWFAYMR